VKSTTTNRLLLYALHSTLYTLLLGCRSTPPPTPLEQLNAQQTHGHAVFQSHCGQCHTDRTGESLHGPTMLGIYKKPYMPSGAAANDDRVTAFILHGKGMMPSDPNIDPQDLQDLLAYMHTL